MGAISTRDARGLYTKMLIAVYNDRRKPTSFLRSFFRVVESDTRNVSIEVERGSEKIAVDVMRGTEGNRNVFDKTTEKIFAPPYYREYFDITDLDLYDSLFLADTVDSRVVARFINKVADKLRLLQDKIERSIEKQCADVLETGILPISAENTTIDFGRKAASLIDSGAGNYWATTTINPFTQIQADIKLMRDAGGAGGSVFNIIMGSMAIADFFSNPFFKERQDFKNLQLDAITGPQAQAAGGTLHGEITAGAYRARIWTYDASYKNEAGTRIPYVNEKKYIILPENAELVLAFAAVPQLVTDAVNIKKGQFIFGDYIDERQTAHIYDIKSAPVAVPVAIDQIVTRKVVA